MATPQLQSLYVFANPTAGAAIRAVNYCAKMLKPPQVRGCSVGLNIVGFAFGCRIDGDENRLGLGWGHRAHAWPPKLTSPDLYGCRSAVAIQKR